MPTETDIPRSPIAVISWISAGTINEKTGNSWR
jgi:hypothetical protein